MTTGRINQVTIVQRASPEGAAGVDCVLGGVRAPDAASPPGVSPLVRTNAPSNCRHRIPQGEVRPSTRGRSLGARACPPQEEATRRRSRREADTGTQAYPRLRLKITIASGQRSTDSTGTGRAGEPAVRVFGPVDVPRRRRSCESRVQGGRQGCAIDPHSTSRAHRCRSPWASNDACDQEGRCGTTTPPTSSPLVRAALAVRPVPSMRSPPLDGDGCRLPFQSVKRSKVYLAWTLRPLKRGIN